MAGPARAQNVEKQQIRHKKRSHAFRVAPYNFFDFQFKFRLLAGFNSVSDHPLPFATTARAARAQNAL